MRQHRRGGELISIAEQVHICAPLRPRLPRLALRRPGRERIARRPGKRRTSFVSPTLLETARKHRRTRASASSSRRAPSRDRARRWSRRPAACSTATGSAAASGLVRGVAAEMKAKRVAKLADDRRPRRSRRTPGSRRAADFSSGQLWPYESGNAAALEPGRRRRSGSLPTIAVVDSGIDAEPPRTSPAASLAQCRSQLAPRRTRPATAAATARSSPASPPARATGYAGAAPGANLVSVDVLNDDGHGLDERHHRRAPTGSSQHKDQYNIRVANFSLTGSPTARSCSTRSTRRSSGSGSAGVVVVAAAGNYGATAAERHRQVRAWQRPVRDHGRRRRPRRVPPTRATTSPPRGRPTASRYDGFRKPELGAPGRYIIGPVPTGATLARAARQRRRAGLHAALRARRSRPRWSPARPPTCSPRTPSTRPTR